MTAQEQATPQQMTQQQAHEVLSAPGAPFEVVEEDVLGHRMKVYKQRFTSLRDVAAFAQTRADSDTFLVYGDRRWSTGQFLREANSVGRLLGERCGVSRGDRVAVLSANNPQWCLTFWGTVDMGAILVGLNGWWKADEILYGLLDSGSRVLVADRGRVVRIADRLGELPDLQHLFLVDCDPADVGLDGDPRVHRFDELLAAPDDRLPDTAIDEDDPAVIFYTSGTTGRPKGAVSTHRSMLANLQNTLYYGMSTALRTGANPLASDDAEPRSSLLTSPLFHVSGCHSGLVVGMLVGVKLVIPVGKFEPVKAMTLIQDEQITSWSSVPTMVWRVVEHPDRHAYDLSSVQSVAYGGSPTSVEMQRRVRETFPNVDSLGNAYGLTESSSVATINSGEDMELRPDSVGRPMPVVDLRITDAFGDEVETGGTGEVWIRGPIVMPGYWNRPDATAETITDDGWLRTGDIGHVDVDGFLYITDRAKDMIIRGGENVYCVEIENRLVEHPAVADAAVIGVAHPTLGEEVKAVVEVAEGQDLTADEVQRWVAETLADFKVPAYVELRREKLPRNASGKLLKNALRGEGEVSFAETM
jgi:long-chain acyl-CoA synthetase